MPKIDELYAFIYPDRDGGEGIVAIQLGNTWFPCVGGDMARITSLWPVIQKQVRDPSKVVLRKFGSARDVTEMIR